MCSFFGSPFPSLSTVCCPASSAPACPHLFSCLLLLSHLIASSLCSSGFAFWILLLSSKATVINYFSQRPSYTPSPKVLAQPIQGPPPVSLCCVSHPPRAPHSSCLSGSVSSCGTFAQLGGKVLLGFSSYRHSLSLCLSPPPLCVGFCSMGCKAWFLLTSFLQRLGFGSPPPCT